MWNQGQRSIQKTKNGSITSDENVLNGELLTTDDVNKNWHDTSKLRRTNEPGTDWELDTQEALGVGHRHTWQWQTTVSSLQDVHTVMTPEYVGPFPAMVPSLQRLTGPLDLSA